jgi:ribosomal protein S18 acetylase RimI-like enzyme
MSCSDCEYRIGTATSEEIARHLKACAESFDPPLHTYVEIENYARKIHDNSITFEAWIGNELVGLIATYYNDTEHKTGFITDTSVIEGYRCHGIAAHLMKQVIKYGIKQDFIQLNLEVGEDNLPARKLYEDNDFIIIGHWNNKLLMSRSLENDESDKR